MSINLPAHLIEKTRNRIIDKVEPEPYSGCWIWIGGYTGGSREVQKRPAMHINRRMDFVSRISFEVFRHPIPERLSVLHKCDSPFCVNPQHLFLGTSGDNMKDMSRKFRGRPRGLQQRTSNFLPTPANVTNLKSK